MRGYRCRIPEVVCFLETWYNHRQMETMLATIPTRSEAQAMDWSLVLASQDIQHAITRTEDGHGWQLAIDSTDYQRAIQALRQYRKENKTPVWLQTLPGTGLVYDWRNLVWFVLLTVLFILGENHHGYLRAAGLMDSQAVRSGEWWRLFTAVLLHGDLPHLASNVSVGVILLGLAMGSLGSGPALLTAYLAGVGGNLAGLLIHAPAHRGLGASGMVMGALGLLTVHSFAFLKAGITAQQLVIRAFLGGVLLLILLGLNPDTDVVAHVGGFVSGCLLGLGLTLLPGTVLENAWVNRLCVLLCGGLVLGTWWLALR